MSDERKVLVVAYDVTELSEDEIDQLELEAVVQGEQSDGHPSVTVLSVKAPGTLKSVHDAVVDVPA